MYKKRTPVLLLRAIYSGLLEEDNYILCMLNNAGKTLQIMKEKELFGALLLRSAFTFRYRKTCSQERVRQGRWSVVGVLARAFCFLKFT